MKPFSRTWVHCGDGGVGHRNLPGSLCARDRSSDNSWNTRRRACVATWVEMPRRAHAACAWWPSRTTWVVGRGREVPPRHLVCIVGIWLVSGVEDAEDVSMRETLLLVFHAVRDGNDAAKDGIAMEVAD